MNHIAGIVAMAALSSFLLNSTTAPVTCQPAPQPSFTGAKIGIGLGVAGILGTVVLVEVHHAHHTINGCVSMGSNGLEVLDTQDKKTYLLAGVTAHTKVGDQVRLHGSKEKLAKGSTSEPTFTVEKVSRDTGPCKVRAAAPTDGKQAAAVAVAEK